MTCLSSRAVRYLVTLLLLGWSISGSGAQTDSPGVIYDSGFYNEEQLKDSTWRWMGAEGVVKLKNAGQDMVLKMKGRAPVDEKQGEPPIMKLHLDGELLDQFPASDKMFEKEYKIAFAKLGDRKWNELKITTTSVIVPSQVNKKSTDDRELGFKLYGLTWLSVTGRPAVSDAPQIAAQQDAAPSRGWLAAAVVIGLVILFLFAIIVAIGVFLHFRRSATTSKWRDRSR